MLFKTQYFVIFESVRTKPVDSCTQLPTFLISNTRVMHSIFCNCFCCSWAEFKNLG